MSHVILSTRVLEAPLQLLARKDPTTNMPVLLVGLENGLVIKHLARVLSFGLGSTFVNEVTQHRE